MWTSPLSSVQRTSSARAGRRPRSGPPASASVRTISQAIVRLIMSVSRSSLLGRERHETRRIVDVDGEVVEEVAAEEAVAARAEARVVGDDPQGSERRAADVDALHSHRQHLGLARDSLDRAPAGVAKAD